MASKKEAKIKFTADTEELSKKIKEVDSEMYSLRAEMRLNEAQFKNTGDEAGYLAKKHELLEKELEANKNKQEALNQEIETAKEIYGENSEEAKKLERQLINTKTQEQQLETQLKDTNDRIEKQGDKAGKLAASLKEAGEKIKAAGDKITDAGKTASVASAAIVGIGTAAVKTTMDFDAEMSKVSAISGTTGDDLQKLRDKAKEMGEKTKFSATESASAFEYMAMAGWGTKDMLDGLEGIMSLAAASGEELSTTSDIVTDALTAFKMTAGESSDLADILAAASSTANTNVTMLGESFKNCAPVCGAMGFSAGDTAIALGLMANSGIKGSEAGTALKTLLTNMANPTDTMANAMEDLGVSLDDGAGNMKSFREIMNDLRDGFGNCKIPQDEFNQKIVDLDEKLESGKIKEKEYNEATEDLCEKAYGAEGALRAKAAAALAGKSGMAGLLSIINASQEDYDKLTGAIDNCTDKVTGFSAAQEMSDTMTDNLSGQVTTLKGTIEGLGIEFGEILTPYISDVVAKIQEVVEWFSGLDEGTKKTITVIALIIAAIGPVLIIIGTVISSIGAITGAIGDVIMFAGKVGDVLSKLFGIMAANPILIVITVIIALVAAFIYAYKHCEKFRNVVDKVFAAVKSVIVSVVEKVTNVFKTIINFVKNNWAGLLLLIVNPFVGAFKLVYDNCEGFRNKIKDIIDKIKSFFSFKITWPKIPTPHFSISPSGWKIGDLLKGSIPKLDIEWYAKGGIFKVPTIIPTLNGLKGFGEAGPEAVTPISVLKTYIAETVSEANSFEIDYDKLGDKVARACGKMNISIDIDERELGRVIRRCKG